MALRINRAHVCDCRDSPRQALTLVCFITESFYCGEAAGLTATQTLTLMIYMLVFTAFCFTETLYSLEEFSHYLMLLSLLFHSTRNVIRR